MITSGARPASQDLALTSAFTNGELPLDYKLFENLLQRNQGTREMKEPAVGLPQPIVANGQAPGKLPRQPIMPPRSIGGGTGARPGASPAGCCFGAGMIGSRPRRANRARAALLSSPRSAISQSGRFRGCHGWPARDGVEGRCEEPDFRRRCRVQVCSQRSTRAIDPYHPLCPLPALGRPDLGAPFFASAKLPSRKHSCQRSFCASFNWASSTSVASHCRSRRQQVLGLPYRAAVRSRGPRSIESRACPRSSAASRPAAARPSGDAGTRAGGGESGPIGHRSGGTRPCDLL